MLLHKAPKQTITHHLGCGSMHVIYNNDNAEITLLLTERQLVSRTAQCHKHELSTTKHNIMELMFQLMTARALSMHAQMLCTRVTAC